MKVIGLGLSALVVYTIMPNLFKDSNGKHLATLAGAVVSAYGLSQLYVIGGATYENMYPAETQKARATIAREQIALIDAKRTLRLCLLSNVDKPRNASRRPTECDELACKYATIAGESELDKMITAFSYTNGN